jgi:hypothetical protein
LNEIAHQGDKQRLDGLDRISLSLMTPPLDAPGASRRRASPGSASRPPRFPAGARAMDRRFTHRLKPIAPHRANIRASFLILVGGISGQP